MKITMLTVTYNSSATLRETIESVLEQDHDDLEYFIVDGASTDGTQDIIRSYEDRLSGWISEPDRGISDAFNKGIRMAGGDVIGILNSDDLLAPGALRKVAQAFRADTDVLYGKAHRLYADGTLRDYLPRDLKIFSYKMPLVHPATFVRRSAYETYGMFEVRYRYCMDRAVLYQMYRGGARFQYLDEYLAFYRMGGRSETHYWDGTLREGEEISVAFGMDPALARLITLYKKGRYLAVRAAQKMRGKRERR